MLAQVWGLGLGFGAGHAAAVGPPAGPVRAVEPARAAAPAQVVRTTTTRARDTAASPARRTTHGPAANDPATGSAPGGGSGTPPAGLTDGSTPIRAPGAADAVEPNGSGVLGSTGLGEAAGTATGTAVGATGGTGDVNQLLHSRIRAGDLPLPGQATKAVPDAFAIAGVLLPSVPPQGRSPQDARSGAGDGQSAAQTGVTGRGGALPRLPLPRGGLPPTGTTTQGQGGLADGWSTAAQARSAGAAGGSTGARAGSPTADGLSGLAASAHTVELTASRDGGRSASVGGPNTTGGGAGTGAAGRGGSRPPGGTAAEGGTTSAEPLAATGSQDAVLMPIAAGLLLTGAAMYKHRGLPRGH
ncbi:hypothetical protein OG500_13985 [Kitasatospora sp. NBC_01250]|uniref:hypothetical protein n=1 Tax=Kitasatospora sp. NBC_01250 TaxID=2903571 RepID=UPI002E360840|nr:hypothetical protein [Kitasatospora sp. NBC_01250]